MIKGATEFLQPTMSTSVQNDFYLYLTNQKTVDGVLQASCRLPSTIDLSRYTYEVSLTEIQLPGIWHNLYDARIIVWSIDDIGEQVQLNLPDGYYTNFVEFARTFERLSKKAEYKLASKALNTLIRFGKSDSGKAYIVLAAGIAVRFTERLMEILSLESTDIVNDADHEDRFQVFPDVNIGQYSLIAESNVVPYSSIGDYTGQVLRVFSPQRNNISGVNVHEIYVPIVPNMLDQINVTLRDTKGRQLIFESDEMVILLHLRKVIKGV